MSDEKKQRGVPRYSLPILIDAPSLSDHPLVPENISRAGFRVEVGERPEVGAPVECSFVVDGKLFQGCRGKVAWVMNNEIFRSSWSVGLAVEIDEERRASFEAALDAVFGSLGEAP